MNSAVTLRCCRIAPLFLAIVAWSIPSLALDHADLLSTSVATDEERSFLQATAESMVAKGMDETRVEEIIRKGDERGLPVRSIVRMLFVAADLDIPGKVPAIVEVDLLPPFQLSAADAARMTPTLEPEVITALVEPFDFDELPDQTLKESIFWEAPEKPRKHGIRNRLQDLPLIDIHWGWFPALPHLPVITPDIPFIRTPAYSVASLVFENLPDIPLVDLKFGRFLTPDIPFVDVNIPFVDKGGEAFGIPWPRPDIPFVKLDHPFLELNTWIFGLPIITPEVPFTDLKTPLDSIIGYIKRL